MGGAHKAEGGGGVGRPIGVLDFFPGYTCLQGKQ